MAEDEQSKPKPGPMTGKYVQLRIAPTTNKGVLGNAIVTHGRLEYVFTPDPRFKVLSTPTQAHYVLETEVEVCPRPTDAEVAAINAIAKYA
jgi:hypothetical protein